MNAKKIIKGIVGLGIMSGVAYLAYKVGEGIGEINERFREKYDDNLGGTDEDEQYQFYDHMDEPNDECLAPASRRNQGYTIKDLEDISSFEENAPDRMRDFAPLSAIRSVPEGVAKSLLLNSVTRGFITNKCIRDTLGVDADTADRTVSEFQNAGYISTEQGGNHRFPTTITFADFVELSEGVQIN